MPPSGTSGTSCGGVNGGSNHCAEECPGYTDPLLPVVVTKGQVAEKQTQEQTLLLQATCPLPEQEEAGRAGFFVLH